MLCTSVCPRSKSVQWVSPLRGSFYQSTRQILNHVQELKPKSDEFKEAFTNEENWALGYHFKGRCDFPIVAGRGCVTYSSLEKVLSLAQTVPGSLTTQSDRRVDHNCSCRSEKTQNHEEHKIQCSEDCFNRVELTNDLTLW